MKVVHRLFIGLLLATMLIAATGAQSVEKAKYVFVFIGDGMSLAQVSAAEVYARSMAEKTPGFSKLGFTQFPAQGLTTTYDSSSIITDSASAGTAIATGNKTASGVISMDQGKTIKFKTIGEYAKEAGMRVGIVSNVSLDHATPAVFYAKAPSRGDMYDIGLQLPKSGFDYFGGGNLAQPRGKNNDQPDVVELARKAGYTVVNDADAFRALKPKNGQKVLAMNAVTQDSMAMPYEMDRTADDLALADYVEKGIELLNNPKGFFMMVESGKIDWACHANDAAASIHDTLAFDRAIAKAVAFQKKYPNDTLIVVTGDHETGGMSIGFAGTGYSTAFEKISLQKGSYISYDSSVLGPYKMGRTAADAKIEDLVPTFKAHFGLEYDKLGEVAKEMIQRSFVRSMKGDVERVAQEDIKLLYGGYEPLTVTLTHLANQMAGIGWTTYSHTGIPVPTFALGRSQNLFNGYYDNTDIFRKLTAIMGIKVTSKLASN